MKLNRTILAVAALVVAAGVIAQRQGVRYEARMNGAGGMKAKVKFQVPDARRLAEFEAQGENLTPNTSYTINLQSGAAYTATTDGFGDFNLNIEFGRNEIPPAITSGSTVWLTNAAGTTLMTGSFGPR